jgi:hypothetical protein
MVRPMPATILHHELQSLLIQAGYAYWNGKRIADRLPARADFDPLLEVPELIRNMMLKDVKRNPLDFRYRLIGTAVRHHLQRDLTGQWMSEIPGQGPGNPLWAYHQRAVESREPVFLRPAYVGPHKEFLCIESVILPLATDDGAVDMLMIFADFLSMPPPQPAAAA